MAGPFSPEALTCRPGFGTPLADDLSDGPCSTTTGESRRALTFVSFSPDGKTFLVRYYQQNVVRLGDATTGLAVGKPLEHVSDISHAAFSPDSRTVVTGSGDRTSRLWDAATGQAIGQPIAHLSEVSSVAYSPDGKTVLTGSGKLAWLWDTRAGLPLGQPLEHLDSNLGSIIFLAYSPDGNTVLTVGQGS